MSIVEGRFFGKGAGRKIAHGFENCGCVRQMCHEKVAERLTFCAQFNESDPILVIYWPTLHFKIGTGLA